MIVFRLLRYFLIFVNDYFRNFLKIGHGIFAHSRPRRSLICHSALDAESSILYVSGFPLNNCGNDKPGRNDLISDYRQNKPLKHYAQPLRHILVFQFMLILFLFFPSFAYSFMSDSEIASFQKKISAKPTGERIALWAEKFVGAPYDPDPMGEYVVKSAIIADERVDCMYLSFRALELALGATPAEAISIALDKRFITKGQLDNRGNVLNYEDRFQYGEDMLDSGKWGREITENLGKVTEIQGSRGRDKVKMISKETILKSIKGSKGQSIKDSDTVTLWRSDTLKSGDFVFFIKAIEKRKVGEIVGHIGIIKTEVRRPKSQVRTKTKKNREIYLIHAGGYKNRGGEVKKVRFYDYVSSMPFIGVKVSRFE